MRICVCVRARVCNPCTLDVVCFSKLCFLSVLAFAHVLKAAECQWLCIIESGALAFDCCLFKAICCNYPLAEDPRFHCKDDQCMWGYKMRMELQWICFLHAFLQNVNFGGTTYSFEVKSGPEVRRCKAHAAWQRRWLLCMWDVPSLMRQLSFGLVGVDSSPSSANVPLCFVITIYAGISWVHGKHPQGLLPALWLRTQHHIHLWRALIWWAVCWRWEVETQF